MPPCCTGDIHASFRRVTDNAHHPFCCECFPHRFAPHYFESGRCLIGLLRISFCNLQLFLMTTTSFSSSLRSGHSRPRTAAHILLVDDLGDMAEASRMILEQAGYRVSVAHDLASATALFESPPDLDLLVTDLVRPGGNGLELANAVRMKNPSIKVLLTTGYPRHTLAKSRAMQLTYPVLTKPFDGDMLLEEVANVLRSSTLPSADC